MLWGPRAAVWQSGSLAAWAVVILRVSVLYVSCFIKCPRNWQASSVAACACSSRWSGSPPATRRVESTLPLQTRQDARHGYCVLSGLCLYRPAVLKQWDGRYHRPAGTPSHVCFLAAIPFSTPPASACPPVKPPSPSALANGSTRVPCSG